MLRRRSLRKRKAKRPNRRLFVESLEGRRLLAGDVAATISGGSLIITGDADDNDILITADPAIPGRVTIESGGDPTTVNGSLLPQMFQATGDIRLRMRDGSDTVTFDGGTTGGTPRDLSFDGGDGDNTFDIFGYAVGRDLKINNRDGLDTNAITDLIARHISISNRSGGSVNTVDGATALSGNLWIRATDGDNSAAVDGVDIARDLYVQFGNGLSTVAVDSALIGDDLTVRTRDGDTTIDLGAVGAVDITDDLVIINGDGVNSISYLASSVGGSASIRNGDDGTVLDFDGVTFGGNVNVRNGDGANSSIFDAIDIGGTLSVSNGDGDNSVTIGDGLIGRDVRISNGDGDYTVDIANVGPVDVGSRVHIRNGNGAFFGGVRVGALTTGPSGDLSIINGDGDNTVELGAFGGGTDIGRGVSVRNGDGDNVFSMNDAAIGRDLTVRNGTSTTLQSVSIGDTALATIGRNVRITHRDGDTDNVVNAADIGGMFYLTSGDGDDTVSLDGTAVGDLTIGGRALIYTDGGNDTLTTGTDVGLTTFGEPVRIRMGLGMDVVTIGAGTIIDALASSFDGGPPNDPLSDTITVTGAVAFDPIDPPIRKRIRNFELILT